MKNIDVIGLLVTFYWFLFVGSPHSAAGAFKVGENNLADLDLELKPMFAEGTEKNLELKKFYDSSSSCADVLQNHEKLLKIVNNYIQRYVSLFLIISGLFNEQEKASDKMITVDFEITLSPNDLDYLQNFAKTSGQSSVLKDLSRLDDILGKIAKRRERGYLESFLRYFNFHQYLPFLTVLLVVWLIYRYSSKKSLYLYASIFLNGMIFWESLNLYKRKVKDAEVELEALRLKRAVVDCDRGMMPGWFSFVVNYVTGCEEYYKTLSRDPVGEVSLLQCIVDTYSLYLIRTPIKILGASIRDLTGELSAIWPSSIRWFVSIPLLPFSVIIVVFMVLIILGKRMKFSFFWTSVEIGEPGIIKETKIITNTRPRLLANYRPLRLLTKSKLFRHSELNLLERKVSVKTSNSEPAVGIENIEKENAPETSAANCSDIAKKED